MSLTVLILLVVIEAAIYGGGRMRAALSRPSRRARLNLA